jgi:hypothetical protein
MQWVDLRPTIHPKMDAALHALTALNNFDGDERWYVDIFVALALGIEGSYRDLNLAFDDHRLNRVAWAARNLMELELWSHFVTVSRVNAKEFHDDRLVDGKDLMTRLIGLLSPHDPLKPFLDPITQMDMKLDSEMALAGIEDDRTHIKIASIAKSRGTQAEYYTMNSLLSKLVHPTAFSILAAIDEKDTSLNCEILLFVGCHYCNIALDRINAHLKALSFASFY